MKINVPAVIGCLGLAFAIGTAFTRSSALMTENNVSVPAPTYQAAQVRGLQTVVFAGGCFWGVQGVYQHVKGVKSAVSGYAGGRATDAAYETVSSGTTGHAEAVRIVYDPAQVSYSTLLQIFFSVVADPTTLNYQGPDRGTQYRTAIFTTTPEQKAITEHYIAQLNKAAIWPKPIVTRIETGRFYKAEAYHQDYLTLHPLNPYIRVNDVPKVEALRRLFPTQYAQAPVLVRADAKSKQGAL